MAPLHLDYQLHADDESKENHNIGYMHKKFNCATYTHKKFGSTFTRSRSVESLKIVEDTKLSVPKLKHVAEQQQENETESHKVAQHTKRNISNGIFRPYALGDNTHRKQRQHPQQHHSGTVQLQEMRKLYQSEGANLHHLSEPRAAAGSVITMPPPAPARPTYAMNHQTFTLMLHKQCEALYVRNMLQLSGGVSPSYSLWPATTMRNSQC